MKSLSVLQMENVQAGQMPCAVAMGLTAISFVALCGATGGWAILGAVSFGGAIWGQFDACDGKF
jgi:hypothetical protein